LPPFETMSTEVRQAYMNEVGKLVAPIVPDDGAFLVIMFDKKGQGMQVGNIEEKKIPKALRELATQMENSQKKKKGK